MPQSDAPEWCPSYLHGFDSNTMRGMRFREKYERNLANLNKRNFFNLIERGMVWYSYRGIDVMWFRYESVPWSSCPKQVPALIYSLCLAHNARLRGGSLDYSQSGGSLMFLRPAVDLGHVSENTFKTLLGEAQPWPTGELTWSHQPPLMGVT